MILTIRTDKPEAEIGLYDGDQKIDYQSWQAHRELAETVHVKIRDMLKFHGKDWPDITGIVAFKGPGSFTGLRIGLTVVNTLAYSLKVPIVGADGNDWAQNGLAALAASQDEQVVMPEYGAEAHITAQKK